MKKFNYMLLITIATLLFVSCKNDVESDSKSLQENLLDAKFWQATKFVVNGENTMPPDNSYILDEPVSSLKVTFNDVNELTMQFIMVDPKEDYIYDSGKLPMSYVLNSVDSTMLISDNNDFTASTSFTGKHKINSLKGDDIKLTGKMGDDFNYELYLSRVKK